MIVALISTPVTVSVSATADVTARLACDTTFGCTISTPPGEVIKKVYSTTGYITLNATSSGAAGEGITEVLPVAATIKTTSDERPVAGEIDITTAVKTYRVAITATTDKVPRHLVFDYPPAPPPKLVAFAPIATPAPQSGEYTNLDPAMLDFGYSSRGRITCVAVFAILPDVQLWCRLPDAVTQDPVVYANDNTPIHARRVATHYLVIDGTDAPLTLVWSDGSKSEIIRTHE